MSRPIRGLRDISASPVSPSKRTRPAVLPLALENLVEGTAYSGGTRRCIGVVSLVRNNTAHKVMHVYEI